MFASRSCMCFFICSGFYFISVLNFMFLWCGVFLSLMSNRMYSSFTSFAQQLWMHCSPNNCECIVRACVHCVCDITPSAPFLALPCRLSSCGWVTSLRMQLPRASWQRSHRTSAFPTRWWFARSCAHAPTIVTAHAGFVVYRIVNTIHKNNTNNTIQRTNTYNFEA